MNGFGYLALSSVCLVKEPHHDRSNWHWLVSFSRQNWKGAHRIPNSELKQILLDWGIGPEWEEDNHEAGNARKFWLPVEEQYRVPCPCKDERVVVDGDYIYSVKTKGTT